MSKDKKTIEDSLSRLEKIVEDLNKENLDVETGLAKFKEGVAIIKESKEKLKKAENEFKKLKEELDFEETEEESLPPVFE